MKHVFALILFSFAFCYPANAALSGTRTIGPSGDYSSITGAIADVQAQSMGGALVLELQAPYVGAVETFPLTIPALNGASAANTLTIHPASGATALAISSANTTAATVDLSGTEFVRRSSEAFALSFISYSDRLAVMLAEVLKGGHTTTGARTRSEGHASCGGDMKTRSRHAASARRRSTELLALSAYRAPGAARSAWRLSGHLTRLPDTGACGPFCAVIGSPLRGSRNSRMKKLYKQKKGNSGVTELLQEL